MRKLIQEFRKGIITENPTLGLVLGLCPALAVSTSLINALGMGTAATFVLVCSNAIVSLLRRFIPERIRLPAFIVIIATFVTICELILQAYFPLLNESLGLFVPLIVVNCIILARAEAFASKNKLLPSIFDGLGMGVGFSLALALIASLREISGSGSILGFTFFKDLQPVTMMILAPGALLTMGALIGFTNWFKLKKGKSPIQKGGCCH